MWDKVSVSTLIFNFLHDHGGRVSEHDLIRHLDRHQCFAAFANEPTNLRLFRKHFITRHCLYHLQEKIAAEWRLDIGMIHIDLLPMDQTGATSTRPSGTDTNLREYYLDLAHLEKADAASVETLLHGFWQSFAAADKSADALAVLDLEQGASWTDIQQAYRRKAQRAHPDHGGEAAAFALVQEAYKILQQRFGRRRRTDINK